MLRFRFVLVLSAAVAACGGGGGGGSSDPPPSANTAPVLTVPTALTGGPVQFSFALPTASTTTLTFTATDADSDPLLWQVGVPPDGQAATGLTFPSPVSGSSLTLTLGSVSTPGSTELSVLVEDSRGAAAAIDLLLVRSGAPTITGVAPSSAFASAPQAAVVTGTAFSLGGSVTTSATFGGVAATGITVVDDTTLTCSTPSTGVLGANAVGVSNVYGGDVLPGSAFTMYSYPVDLFAADTMLDAGNGAQLDVAIDGAVLNAVWIEAGGLSHARSTDGGASWSSAQTLSGAETPSSPRVVVAGDAVTVVWIGDGTTLFARSSADGVTFDAAVTLNPTAGGAPAAEPQVAASGGRRHCAWLQGSSGAGQQRVWVVSSADAGASWTAAGAVDDNGANQRDLALGCEGASAWLAYFDDPQGLTTPSPGVHLSRTTDGGLSWTAGIRRSAASISIDDVRLCHDGDRVYLVWTRDGALKYVVSSDLGVTWPTQATEIRSTDLGFLTAPAVACEGERLFVAYVAGGQNVAFSRIGAAGASPESVTLSSVVESVGRPSLAQRGNYVFATWRSGDVGGGTARVRFATSVNLGVSFTAPLGLGDGLAAQDLPLVRADSARLWFGWLDYRGATPALFTNRTEQ